MWYGYQGENGLIALTPERVKEIVKLNKEGIKPKDLKDFEIVEHKEAEVGYSNVVGQDSVNRFEKKFNNQKNQNRRKKKNNQGNKNNSVRS
jgi:hypothetical protein